MLRNMLLYQLKGLDIAEIARRQAIFPLVEHMLDAVAAVVIRHRLMAEEMRRLDLIPIKMALVWGWPMIVLQKGLVGAAAVVGMLPYVH